MGADLGCRRSLFVDDTFIARCQVSLYCDELFGDTLDRAATWKSLPELGNLAGTPVRLRIVLTDADLYSLVFAL